MTALAPVATYAPKNQGFESPPSSARVLSGLSMSFLGSSPSSSSLASLGSPVLHNPFADDPRSQQPQLSPKPSQHSPRLEPVLPRPPFQHKVISVSPGAHSIISDAVLKEAVEFLKTQVALGKKVLVHCRDGNGRSGSVAVAFVASQLEKNDGRANGQKSSHYDESLQEVWKWKCDVYPHKGLEQSLERIVW